MIPLLPQSQNRLLLGLCLISLVISSKAYFERCKANSDCSRGSCCVDKVGFCMRNKQLGELCSNSYLKGRTPRCGCAQNLTCAIVSRDPEMGIKHRCVEIPPEAKELQENNATAIVEKYLTSRELARLLKLMEERPKLNIKRKT